MYFYNHIQKSFFYKLSFIENPVGPSQSEMQQAQNEAEEKLSPKELERVRELQQIQAEISLVVNAKEITTEYRDKLYRGFLRVQDDLGMKDEIDTDSDYYRLIHKIGILQDQIQKLSEEELRLKLREVQGETTSALHDLMGDVAAVSIEGLESGERAEYYKEAYNRLSETIDGLEGLNDDQKSYLQEIISNAGGLENISSNDIYLMKSLGIDLTSLFLVSASGNASKENMKEGDTYLVNFLDNTDVDATIGAGDILDIANVYRVKINGIEGIRAASPRPGYYTPDGRYLAIHDGYTIDIVEKKAYSPEESQEDFQNAANERLKVARRGTIISWVSENLADSDDSVIRSPFVMDIDSEILKEYVESSFQKDEKSLLSYNTDSHTIHVIEEGKTFKDVFASYVVSGEELEALAGKPLPESLPKGSVMRTDRHNNPTAANYTPSFAKKLRAAGLVEGRDFWAGETFDGTGSWGTVAYRDISVGIRGAIVGLENGQIARWYAKTTASKHSYKPQMIASVKDAIGVSSSASAQSAQSTFNKLGVEGKKSVVMQIYSQEGGKYQFYPIIPGQEYLSSRKS